jgi:hypothetical protein
MITQTELIGALDEALDEALTPPSAWPSIGSAIPNVVIVLKVLAASVSAGRLEIKGWDVLLLLGCAFAAIVIITNYGVARGKHNRLVRLAKKKVVKLRAALASLEATENVSTTHVRVNVAEISAEHDADESPASNKTRHDSGDE